MNKAKLKKIMVSIDKFYSNIISEENEFKIRLFWEKYNINEQMKIWKKIPNSKFYEYNKILIEKEFKINLYAIKDKNLNKIKLSFLGLKIVDLKFVNWLDDLLNELLESELEYKFILFYEKNIN